MPDRDFNPQDGGYIRVMNEFVDKLIHYRLDSSEWSILMLVVRTSWGIRGRPWAELSWHDIVKKTCLPRPTIYRAVRKLRGRNILQTATDDERRVSYKINSKVSTWRPWPFEKNTIINDSKSLSPVIVNTITNDSKSLSPVIVNTITNDSNHYHQRDYTFKNNIKTYIKDTPIVPAEKKPPTAKDNHDQDAKAVIDFINQISGKAFKHSKTSLEPVLRILKQGYSLEQCLAVCKNKWLDPDHKEKYYRPVTLFRPKLFESYVNERGRKDKPTAPTNKHERRNEKWRRRHEGYENETDKQTTRD